MSKILCAASAAAAAACLATPSAAATVIYSGTLQEYYGVVYASALIDGMPGKGIYTFTADAVVEQYEDISIAYAYKYHGHTDDGLHGWGQNWYWGSPDTFGVAEPEYHYNPNGYTVTFTTPADQVVHYNECWIGDSCGYTEYYEYRTQIYLAVRFPLTSAGKSFSLTYSPYAEVPEPSTWAMMILGFSIAGAGLRTARAQRRAQLALLLLS